MLVVRKHLLTLISINIISENITLGYELRWNNHEEDFSLVDLNSYCLSEKSLLELITYIPVLLPFKPEIDEAIKLYGEIPAHLFSICIEVDNLNIDIQHRGASGSIDLDATIMYELCVDTYITVSYISHNPIYHGR